MSGRQYSDNPSPTQTSAFEMEQIPERDGVLIGNSTTTQFRLCHSRNLALVFLFVLAFYISGTDILESRDMSLPGMDDDVVGPWSALDNNEDEDETGDQTTDEDDDQLNNKVDLNAKNPKRDGVEFVSPSCNYTCMTDRLPHESPLYPGQVLCNREHRFGMNEDGEFFLQDCQADTTTIFWSAKDEQLTDDQYPVHFQMKKSGYFQVISDPSGDVLLDKHPKRNIPYFHTCLSPKPKLDCPYLHLHSDGVVVLNWIDDETGDWQEKNVKQQYKGLFPDAG